MNTNMNSSSSSSFMPADFNYFSFSNSNLQPIHGRCLILNYIVTKSSSSSSTISSVLPSYDQDDIDIEQYEIARNNVQFLTGMFKALHFEVFQCIDLNVSDSLQIFENGWYYYYYK